VKFLINQLILFCHYTEKNGKTLHLLKSGSKPTPAKTKRKKVAIMGSFEDYAKQQ